MVPVLDPSQISVWAEVGPDGVPRAVATCESGQMLWMWCAAPDCGPVPQEDLNDPDLQYDSQQYPEASEYSGEAQYGGKTQYVEGAYDYENYDENSDYYEETYAEKEKRAVGRF